MGAFRYRQQSTGTVYDLLPPEKRTGALPASRFERKQDIADAEFVTVPPVRPRNFTPGNANAGSYRPAKPRPATASMRALAIAAVCLRLAERWLQRASLRTFTILVAAMALLAFGLSGGFSGLSTMPAAVPSAPLQFSHVTLTPQDADGMRVLVVNGIIENDTDAATSVPPIRADLASGDRLVASVVVAPPSDRIGARESRGFMARLRHPGGKMPEVRLSFMH